MTEAPSALFSEMARSEPRKTGILPSQEIRELIRNGKIRSTQEITDGQIQPASMDLRLGNVAYRIQASFLPGRSSTIETKIKDLCLAQIDLTKPALLEKDAVFIVPLVESLALPSDIGGKANPKSTTGRLDIFTRLITDGGLEFERVPTGYKGGLYVEIVSRTFPIVVGAGTKLNQLRFVRGKPPSGDGVLEQLAQRERLVYYDNGDTPEEAVVQLGLDKLPPGGEPTARAYIDRGLRTTIDLEGVGDSTIVAYKARRNCPPVDLSKVGAHAADDFWEAIVSPKSGGLVLDPGDFYILSSKERFCVPAGWAAEMEPFDQSSGDFSVHYAGFFDPGFGYGAKGEIKGTRGVLEVRAHEVPILLEDTQIVGRLVYHRMADVPDILYGVQIGSSYQKQGLALSKQFRMNPAAPSSAQAAAQK
jgi:dCTP deaminase